MFLALESVSRSYGDRRAVNRVSFAVASGELVSIVGPSGAGKTTLLKIIAGLETPDAGRLVSEVDLNEQPAILVFQDYLLFPTMSVFDNVAFGLRCRSVDRRTVRNRVLGMLEYFQLDGKADQFPAQLSAGQKQRVALARAMVINPAILLLDEPFANLDRNLKAETAEFIRSFQREYRITTLCVTHDLHEAFLMSDKIGIMLDGELCQFDDVKTVYRNPASGRVAAFLGHVNLVPAALCAALGADVQGAPGPALSIRAEALELSASAHGAGIVEEVRFAGHFVIYRVVVGGESLVAYRFSDDLAVGDRVDIHISQTLNVMGENE